MPGIASLLIVASTVILLVLGSIHLFYTFRGRMLFPREEELIDGMKRSALVLTRETTVWKAWIGFNASHSFGILMFALVYAWLALAAPHVLFGSIFLRILGLAFLLTYVALARRYWFSVPFRGVALAAVLYLAGLGAGAL